MTKDSVVEDLPQELLNKRLEFSEKAFAYEKERRETLEKKSQIYLALLILFLGTFSLKEDSLLHLGAQLAKQEAAPFARVLVNFEIAGLVLSVFFSFLSVVMALGLKIYQGPYPRALSTFLFSPCSKRPAITTLEVFVQEEARRYCSVSRPMARQRAVGFSRDGRGVD